MNDPTAHMIRELAVDVALVRVRWDAALLVYEGAARSPERVALRQVRSSLARAQEAVARATALLDAIAPGQDAVATLSESANMQVTESTPDDQSGVPINGGEQ